MIKDSPTDLMTQILVYSDSLSWGLIPDTRKRFSFDVRWPGVLEKSLQSSNHNIRVIENCLNGRRTVWDDPFKGGRNASKDLAYAIEINSPISLVLLLLGTNDFQSTHDNTAWLSAQGIKTLINIIRLAQIEPGMPVPEILVIAPPAITIPKGAIAHKFINADARCENLATELKLVADENSAYFFDAGSVVKASSDDGVHLDKSQHRLLGEAVADIVSKISAIRIDT